MSRRILPGGLLSASFTVQTMKIKGLEVTRPAMFRPLTQAASPQKLRLLLR